MLVIDYVKQGLDAPSSMHFAWTFVNTPAEQSKPGMRKVAAQEFDSIHGLKHLYSTVRKEHLVPAQIFRI